VRGGADATMAVSPFASTAGASAVGQVPRPNFTWNMIVERVPADHVTMLELPVHGSCVLRLVSRSGGPTKGRQAVPCRVIPVDRRTYYASQKTVSSSERWYDAK